MDAEMKKAAREIEELKKAAKKADALSKELAKVADFATAATEPSGSGRLALRHQLGVRRAVGTFDQANAATGVDLVRLLLLPPRVWVHRE
jgi:hypothetical protein